VNQQGHPSVVQEEERRWCFDGCGYHVP
jgi:hypothetical protein